MKSSPRIPHRYGPHADPLATSRPVRSFFHERILEIAILLGCLAAFLPAGCATAPRTATGESEQGRILDMGEYTVSAPPGSDWSVEKEPDAGSVTFSRRKTWWTGRVLGATIISVRKNRVEGDAPLLDEEAEADRYRDHEEAGMIEMGVKTGQYELYDVRREKATLDGREFYLLRYKQRISRGALRPDLLVEAALHIHYPPDFKKRRVFYLFHISDSTEKGAFATVDTGLIEQVIGSFRLKETVRTSP